MCEMMPKQFVEEFERLSSIAPNMDAYFCEYTKQRMSKMMPLIQDLINFVEQNSKFKCFYLNKYEFIDYSNQDRPFFNKRKLEERVNEICSNYEKATEAQKNGLLNTIYEYFLNKGRWYFSAIGFVCFDSKSRLFVIVDRNVTSFCEETAFHELCHYLQHIYDSKLNKQRMVFDKILNKTQSGKKIEEIKKKRFLNTCIIETQANLFGYMVVLLYGLNDKNFEELKHPVLFKSKYSSNRSDGYCEYPLLMEEIKNMQEHPEQYQRFFTDKFISFRNTMALYPKNPPIISTVKILDYKKLYDYTMKKVLDKSKELLARALTDPEEFTLETIRLENPKDLSYHIDSFIHYVEFCTGNKKLSLKFCEYQLETFKTNLSRKLSERLDGAFNTLLTKLKEVGVKVI